MSFVEFDGARFHYRIDGPADAPVVVLSNSLGSTLAMWDPQIAALARGHRVLRYDSRGHGQSAVTPGPYTIEQCARDVVKLIDALALDRVDFCGLSMGGMVGQWLGVNAPSRLRRLVLCNTAARIAPPEAWNARIAKVNEGGMAAIADAVLARWFRPAFAARNADVVAPYRAMLLANDPAGYVAACAAVRDMDQREAIAGIGVPTLVIAGRHDVSTTPSDARFLAAAIPGAAYIELDAAHFSNVEAAPGFSRVVVDFISA